MDRIIDVEKNTKPFDSLVLPDGYKDLILSFVENQLKDGEAFDDVINGKGGGLVMLLAGDPGVGKTMTAESGMYRSIPRALVFVNDWKLTCVPQLLKRFMRRWSRWSCRTS